MRRVALDIEQIAADYAHGVPVIEIAKARGVSGMTIHNRLRDAGVVKRDVRLSGIDIAKLAEEYAQGATSAELARAYGVSGDRIRWLLRCVGVAMRRRGPRRTRSAMTVCGDVARMELRGRGNVLRGHAAMDAADVPLVGGRRWCLDGDGYVCRGERGPDGRIRRVWLHRVLLGLAHGDPREVDHRNGVRTDCRRANLRIVTDYEQAQNQGKRTHRNGRPTTGRYRGVSYQPKYRLPWVASVMSGGTRVFYERFADEESAAVAAAEAREKWMSHNVEARHPAPAAGVAEAQQQQETAATAA